MFDRENILIPNISLVSGLGSKYEYKKNIQQKVDLKKKSFNFV